MGGWLWTGPLSFMNVITVTMTQQFYRFQITPWRTPVVTLPSLPTLA
jgi:hypothetical protein